MWPYIQERESLLPAHWEAVRGCHHPRLFKLIRHPPAPDSWGSVFEGKDAGSSFLKLASCPYLKFRRKRTLHIGRRVAFRTLLCPSGKLDFYIFEQNREVLKSGNSGRTNDFESLLCWSNKSCLVSKKMLEQFNSGLNCFLLWGNYNSEK